MAVSPFDVDGFVAINKNASNTYSVKVNDFVAVNRIASNTDPAKINNFASGNMSTSDTDSVKGDDSLTATGDTIEATTKNASDIDAVDQPEGLIDPSCKALHSGKPCATQSGNHRKVISHVFGRNKTSTQQLPDDCWILWCRMHYQRNRYRDVSLGVWHKRQLEIVRDQLNAFEAFNAEQKWTIALRKATQDTLNAENLSQVFPALNDADTDCDETPACWERFLAPYTGPNKTFADIRNVLVVIENEFNTPAFLARDNKEKVFPGVEFLAASTKDKVKNPVVRRKVNASTPLTNGTMLNAKTPVEASPPIPNRSISTLPLRKHKSTPNVATQAIMVPHILIRKRKSADDVTTGATMKPQKRRHLVRDMDLPKAGPQGPVNRQQ